MGRCCVIGCTSTSGGTKSSLSWHRLPRNAVTSKKWTDAIGLENIRSDLKAKCVCSLHFPKTAFNRTLDVVRLRDDAVPIRLHREQSTDEDNPDFKTETNQGHGSIEDNSPLSDIMDPLELHPVEIKPEATEHVHDIYSVQNQMEQSRIQKLERKCESLRNKVKTLKGKVRRQKDKIDNFNNIIKNLLEKNLLNESIVIVEVSEKR